MSLKDFSGMEKTLILILGGGLVFVAVIFFMHVFATNTDEIPKIKKADFICQVEGMHHSEDYNVEEIDDIKVVTFNCVKE